MDFYEIQYLTNKHHFVLDSFTSTHGRSIATHQLSYKTNDHQKPWNFWNTCFVNCIIILTTSHTQFTNFTFWNNIFEKFHHLKHQKDVSYRVWHTHNQYGWSQLQNIPQPQLLHRKVNNGFFVKKLGVTQVGCSIIHKVL